MVTRRLLQTARFIALYLLIAFSIGACQKQSFTTTSLGTSPGTPVSTPGCCSPAIIHWAASKDLPLSNPAAIGREMSYGFSINSKGYICAGFYDDGVDGDLFRATDTWEFDPSTSAWTQKADYPSLDTYGGATFVIGNSAYIVASGNQENWQYNQTANTWSQKANFPRQRQYTTGFSVGGVGYVGGGDNMTGPGANHFSNEWYMYVPAFDNWTRIANFPGRKRENALGFVVGNNGYVCLGDSSDYSVNDYFHDLWQYNAPTNTWTKKAEFPAKGRRDAVGLSVNGAGVVTTGVYGTLEFASSSTAVKDTWKYTPGTDTWTQLPDFGGGVRGWASGFAIGNNVYVGGGNSSPVLDPPGGKKDLWVMAL
jgi:N-acetylneuraminic acid mutarotase